MGQGQTPVPRWRSVRVPLRVVERIFGRGNDDNAGDDMAFALNRVSEWPGQYGCHFTYDTAHPNPWYHSLVFEVEGVPDSVFARLVELLTEDGMAPEVG